jgi:hypothetical protein
VDFENGDTSFGVGRWELDLPVDPTGPKESGVKDVYEQVSRLRKNSATHVLTDSVGGHDDLIDVSSRQGVHLSDRL